MPYSLSIAQDRRTKAQFTASNPVLLADQLAIETDSNVATTGDGTSAYLAIRGNTTLSGDDRRSADDVYAGQTLGDGRDEVGETGTIDDGSITNAKLADMATARIKGRATAGTGVPEDLTANQASTILDAATDPFVRTSGLPVSPIPPSWEMTLAAAVTPTTGQVTPNNDTASAVTTLKYYENDRGTVNRSADFALMRVGGIITNEQIAQGDGITQEDAVKFRITGAPTLASNVWTIPVAHVSGVFSGILSFWYVSYAGNVDPDVTVPVVTVSGAGTAGANGNYYRNGSRGDKPMYRKGEYFIYWSVDQWVLENSDGNAYITNNNPLHPWTGTWEEDTLSAPVPTVTEGSASVSLSTAVNAALNLY